MAQAGLAASSGLGDAANSTSQLAFGVQSIQKNVDNLNTAKLADFGEKIKRVNENMNLSATENENVERTITNINRVAIVGQQATEAASEQYWRPEVSDETLPFWHEVDHHSKEQCPLFLT